MLMLLSLLAARLFQLQGVGSCEELDKTDKGACQNTVTIPLPASRGDIVDRTGQVLAESASGDMIIADPTMTVTNAPHLAQLLTDRLGLDYFSTLQSLTTDKISGGTPLRFAYIARRVPADKATAVVNAANAAGWPGLFLNPDPIRYYPGDDVAANLVGFLNGSGGPAAGLEQTFNTILSGRDGSQTCQAGDGACIPLGENTEVAPVYGQTLHLTIDRDVQWTAQRLLRQAVLTNRAESGAVVVMDTHSGQLLALADYPSYNANDPQASASTNWVSRAVTDPYEPGSVEKVLTSSALIQEGLVTPETKVVVPPSINIQGHNIHDEETHGYEHLTLAGILAVSSNIGMVRATLQSGQNHHGIGSVTMGNYLKAFGLGGLTDMGLPGESQGQLPNPASWSQLTHAEIAFGQGVGVTAVQMAAAVNTVANGGVYIAPSLILGKAKDALGNVVGSDVATTRRVVSAATATQVTHMMETVTEPGGTAPLAKIPGYDTAGKTGTAQEVGANCGCYNQVTVSFAGFAPADNPRFTVYVVLQHPANQAAASGSGMAGPVFRQLMAYLLQKYSVPPSGTAPVYVPTTW